MSNDREGGVFAVQIRSSVCSVSPSRSKFSWRRLRTGFTAITWSPGTSLKGRSVSFVLWLGGVAYLIVPFAFGRFTAWGYAKRASEPDDGAAPDDGTNRFRRWIEKQSVKMVSWYTDTAPAPRAWDYMWSRPGLSGWVVLHLKEGGDPIAGEWNGSYAAGYPEPGDLYIAEQVEVDPDGTMLTEDFEGVQLPIRLGKSLLIRWDEIKYLDFYGGTIASDGDPASAPGDSGESERGPDDTTT